MKKSALSVAMFTHSLRSVIWNVDRQEPKHGYCIVPEYSDSLTLSPCASEVDSSIFGFENVHSWRDSVKNQKQNGKQCRS